MYDAIVVGAGHNGLVTAGYLARVGWKVLVLERRPLVGGACVTEEVFPGYRVSTAAYLVSLMQERVVRDLELRRFGYDVLPKEPAYFAPHLDGRYLFMYADQHRTREALARFSAKDAERYPAYEQFVERLARFMEPLLLQAPPNLPPRTPADFQALARLGWHVLRRPPAEIGQIVKQIEAYRCEGSSFKINLALGELPSYSALPGTSPGPQHRGTTHICASLDSLEHAWDEARSGTPSSEPLLEITIPTVYDRSLAPDGKHILSIFAQYAPYRLRDGQWDAATRGAFVERVIGLLEQYAPNIRGSIEHVHALSPLDLEQEYGLTGGNIFHGELRLDQLFALRPVAGWARYATPVVGLYLCGSGTHPGGGVTGAPGHNAAQVILRSAKQGQKSYALFLANNPTMEARHGRRSIAER